MLELPLEENDLKCIIKLIEISSKNGLIPVESLINVGVLYHKIQNIIDQITQSKDGTSE